LTDSDPAAINRLADRLSFTADLKDVLLSASLLKRRLPELSYRKASEWTFDLDDLPPASIYGVHLITGRPELFSFLAEWRHVKPLTTGDDLKNRGLEPGPRFGEILRRLRTAWLDGEVKTGEEETSILESLIR
jgi:hypothetical protein